MDITKTLKNSSIGGYQGQLTLVEDRRGDRYLETPCSLKGRRYFGPLKRHHVASFNAIADLQEVEADARDCRVNLPEAGRLRGADVASAQDEREYFVFDLEKDYDQGDLDAHLRYLRTCSGTPDFFASAETLAEAVDEARGSAPAAITNDLFEVVDIVDQEAVEA